MRSLKKREDGQLGDQGLEKDSGSVEVLRLVFSLVQTCVCSLFFLVFVGFGAWLSDVFIHIRWLFVLR